MTTNIHMRRFVQALGSRIGPRRGQICYGQEGEDMILRRLFHGQERGFYVDVGAFHPWRFSNTYYFYRHGWHGINIDATPGIARLFRKARPRDIHIEALIGNHNARTEFFIFREPAYNSANQKLSRARQSAGVRIVRTVVLEARRLGDVLSSAIHDGIVIDFMSVDTEGNDLDVLKSNDWDRFRPRFLLVEEYGVKPAEMLRGDTQRFLQTRGYDFFAKTVNTTFFNRRD